MSISANYELIIHLCLVPSSIVTDVVSNVVASLQNQTRIAIADEHIYITDVTVDGRCLTSNHLKERFYVLFYLCVKVNNVRRTQAIQIRMDLTFTFCAVNVVSG